MALRIVAELQEWLSRTWGEEQSSGCHDRMPRQSAAQDSAARDKVMYRW